MCRRVMRVFRAACVFGLAVATQQRIAVERMCSSSRSIQAYMAARCVREMKHGASEYRQHMADMERAARLSELHRGRESFLLLARSLDRASQAVALRALANWQRRCLQSQVRVCKAALYRGFRAAAVVHVASHRALSRVAFRRDRECCRRVVSTWQALRLRDACEKLEAHTSEMESLTDKARLDAMAAEADKAELTQVVLASSRRLNTVQLELDVSQSTVESFKQKLHASIGSSLTIRLMYQRLFERHTSSALACWKQHHRQSIADGAELHYQCLCAQLEANAATLSAERDDLLLEQAKLQCESDDMRREVINMTKSHRQSMIRAEEERKKNVKLSRQVENLEGRLFAENGASTPSLGGICIPRWKVKPTAATPPVRRKKNAEPDCDASADE